MKEGKLETEVGTLGSLAVIGILLWAFVLRPNTNKKGKGKGNEAPPGEVGPTEISVVGVEGLSPLDVPQGGAFSVDIDYRHKGKGGELIWAIHVHDRPWAPIIPGVHTENARRAAFAYTTEPDRINWGPTTTVRVSMTLPMDFPVSAYDVWCGHVSSAMHTGAVKREGIWKDNSLGVLSAGSLVEALTWSYV